MVATLKKDNLWPQGRIPYQLNSSPYKSDIEKAMRQIETWCGVRFIPRTSEADFLNFEHQGKGAWSKIGCVRGGQRIVVNRGYIALHELLHGIGVIHEQCRSDRDNWIVLQTANMQDPNDTDFAKKSSQNYTAYDHLSVSHYPAPSQGWGTDESVDGELWTMRLRSAPDTKLGPGPNQGWSNLSELDKQGLGAIYNIRLRNNSDKVVSWFCYAGTDTAKAVALASGELKANGGNTFYLPPWDATIDSYFIDFKVFLRAVGSPATVSRGGQVVTLVNGSTTTVTDYRTTPPPPPPPPPVGPPTTARGGVTGPNMAEVTYGTPGRTEGIFRQVDANQWVETDADGAVRFHFVEEQRDDWSVYLQDDTRGYGIQLDVFKNRIRVNTATTPWAFLYRIIDSRRHIA